MGAILVIIIAIGFFTLLSRILYDWRVLLILAVILGFHAIFYLCRNISWPIWVALILSK